MLATIPIACETAIARSSSHRLRFARRDVCALATEILYCWRKICPESYQGHWLLNVVGNLAVQADPNFLECLPRVPEVLFFPNSESFIIPCARIFREQTSGANLFSWNIAQLSLVYRFSLKLFQDLNNTTDSAGWFIPFYPLKLTIHVDDFLIIFSSLCAKPSFVLCWGVGEGARQIERENCNSRYGDKSRG